MSTFARCLAVPLLFGVSGCVSCDGDRSPGYIEPATQPGAQDSPPAPPSVDAISIATWPPLGPNGIVQVSVSDECCLSEVHFTFASFLSLQVSGTHDEVEASGSELGEGLGTLFVDALDEQGASATRMVTNLLVDLTPPKAEVGSTVLRANGSGNGAELEVWVGDAWVLGSVTVEFQGVSKVHTFPEVYPDTLGTDWDHSFESFPTSDFPAGTGPAKLTVVDAAGNTTVQTINLVLDGTPPEVSIVSPSPGTLVSGAFEVSIDASDDEGPTSIEVRMGGTPVATATGPHASIGLDASDFVPGPIALEAVAIDAAGNETVSAAVPLIIE